MVGGIGVVGGLVGIACRRRPYGITPSTPARARRLRLIDTPVRHGGTSPVWRFCSAIRNRLAEADSRAFRNDSKRLDRHCSKRFDRRGSRFERRTGFLPSAGRVRTGPGLRYRRLLDRWTEVKRLGGNTGVRRWSRRKHRCGGQRRPGRDTSGLDRRGSSVSARGVT